MTIEGDFFMNDRLMKKLLNICTLISLSLFYVSHALSTEGKFIKGGLAVKGSDDAVPQFRVYFHGTQVSSDTEGFFTFSIDDMNFNKYSLLITKDIKFSTDTHNMIDHMSVIPNKKYKFYTFKQFGTTGQWRQKEKTLDKKKLIIPTNTIVVLVDPKYVDHIEQWNIKSPQSFIPLPKIILNPEIKGKLVARAGAKSLLKSLDCIAFHEHNPGENIPKTAETNPKVKISLP